MSEMQGILSGMYKVPFPPPPPFGEENQVGKKGMGREEGMGMGREGKGKGKGREEVRGKKGRGRGKKRRGIEEGRRKREVKMEER